MPAGTDLGRNSLFSRYDARDACLLRLDLTMATRVPAATRIWLLPFSLVGGACLVLFAATFLLDAARSPNPSDVFRLLLRPNPAAAFNTLTNTGDIVAAVLAIALTVVAIVVELASNRYTHRVTELFISEPVNFAVMALFVVTSLQGAWVTMTFDYEPGRVGFVPYTGIGLAMVLLTLCLLILLPYFNFVFSYLNPIQIVERIRRHTLQAIERAKKDLHAVQREAVRGVEQLGDVALNAMQNHDTGVSMAAVDALLELTRSYQRLRGSLPEAFFRVDGELARNPDFISMDKVVLAQVGARRIWLEMKILRQYQMVFGEALNRMRDVSYVIAINTRLLAEEAAQQEHVELLELLVKFFNTFLRAAINQRDVRTAYNLTHQYRLLAQSLLVYRQGAYAVEIARHFHYYGQVSYAAQLPFILETVAYDLCGLNEVAHERKLPLMDELLDIFLRVDKEGSGEAHEASLRGVRKAQVKLATYYLLHGDEPRARRVYDDMAHESAQRLSSIRDELLAVRSSEYWEVIDRGVNFDYLPPERKEKLEQFFAWFGGLPPVRPVEPRV
jgi:hypothetical protein